MNSNNQHQHQPRMSSSHTNINARSQASGHSSRNESFPASSSSNSSNSAEAFAATLTTNPVTRHSQNTADRPVTRSLAKRNIQQLQHQQQVTNSAVDYSGNIDSNNNSNNNNGEKILKLIQLGQQQLHQTQECPTPQPPQKTYQKIIPNERPCNIINILENSRLYGRTIKNISTVKFSFSFCFFMFLQIGALNYLKAESLLKI